MSIDSYMAVSVMSRAMGERTGVDLGFFLFPLVFLPGTVLMNETDAGTNKRHS